MRHTIRFVSAARAWRRDVGELRYLLFCAAFDLETGIEGDRFVGVSDRAYISVLILSSVLVSLIDDLGSSRREGKRLETVQ